MNVVMIRIAENQLLEWKSRLDRKPLIVRGARQIGKSWTVEHFGKTHYKGKTHIVNFEKRADLHQIFELNFDVKRIVLELEIQLNTIIDSKKDLVFFDEIQACPKALMALRYFYEDMPDLHIISAGSLLDFTLKNISYPVGRVEQMDMYPMTFHEFLLACQQEKIAELLNATPQALSESIDNAIKFHLTRYFVVGGMPACVKTFVETNSLISVVKIQDDLLYSIREDFKKYSPSISSDCLNDVLTYIAANIGSQIKYTRLSERFTGPTIKKGFELLKTARIIHQVQNVSLAGLPLVAGGIQFKALFLDVGLLIRIANLSIKDDFTQGTLISAFKGALTEQFIGQELKAKNYALNYWTNLDKGTMSELDYVIENRGDIYPVEVKSGTQGSLKSLHIVLQKYSNLKKGIVFSNARFGLDKNIQFLPLYWVSRIDEVESITK